MDELVKVCDGKITVAEDLIEQIKEFNKQKKEMEYQESLLKDGLMKAMQETGIKKFIINGLSASIKEGSTRTTLDSKRLKEECPDIYEAYSKTSEVKNSIVLTIAD